MFKVKLHDGTTEEFEDLKTARGWARLQLHDWMEPGDQIVMVRTSKSWIEVVHDSVGIRTDATAVIQKQASVNNVRDW